MLFRECPQKLVVLQAFNPKLCPMETMLYDLEDPYTLILIPLLVLHLLLHPDRKAS